MKRTFLALFTVLILFVLLITPVHADTVEGAYGANLLWKLEDGTLTISGTGPMDYYVHQPWFDYRDQIHTVIISEGITSVSAGAFSKLYNLTSVSMPATVTSLGSDAFSDCFSLTTLPLNNNILSIGSKAFSGCSITTLSIPSSISVISWSAFSNCKQLQSVIIPSTVTTIENYAFHDCFNLTSVTIPDSVTSIGGSAFSNCLKLTEITLPNRLSVISNTLFSGCSNLRSITIPDSVTTIESYSFNNCASLQSVHIGSGVSEISTSAFWKCPNLTGFSVSSSNPYFSTDRGFIYNKNKTSLVRAPQGFSGSYSVLPGTQTIERRACFECAGITSLSIPSSVTSIGQYACDGLYGLQTLTLSNGLSYIGPSAFSLCSKLQTLTIPATVTHIDQLAFSNCSSLKEITFLGAPPTIESRSFSNVTATVYYPSSEPAWKDSEHLYGGILKWVATNTSCNGKHMPEAIPGKAPTCTESGLSDGAVCQRCGEVIAKQETLPVTDHSYGEWEVTVAATKDAEGLKTRTCSVCQAVEESVLPALSDPVTHSPVPTKPAVTPTEPEPTPAETEATPAETESTPTVSETVPAEPETHLPQETEAPSPTIEALDATVTGADEQSQVNSDYTVWIIAGVIVLLAGINTAVLLKRKVQK